MMHKTHIKIGQTLYIASIPLLTKVGLMPDIVGALKGGDSNTIALGAVAFGASAFVGFHGASWGAGAPDIDQPTSIPAKKNPLISKTFQALGVKHRGKLTHSMDSVTLIFLIMYLAVVGIFSKLGFNGVIGNVVDLVSNVLKVWVISAYVGAISHLIADSLTKQGVRILFFLPPVKLVGTKNNVGIISVVVLMVTGFLPNVFSKGLEPTSLVVGIVGAILAYVFSGMVYEVVNKKGMGILKILSVILYGTGIVLMFIFNLQELIKVELIVQLTKVFLITGFVTSVIPGLDFFKTGDDSTWEKIVRNLFNILLPVSYVVVPLLMFVK